jgi:hypothetical protein
LYGWPNASVKAAASACERESVQVGGNYNATQQPAL